MLASRRQLLEREEGIYATPKRSFVAAVDPYQSVAFYLADVRYR